MDVGVWLQGWLQATALSGKPSCVFGSLRPGVGVGEPWLLHSFPQDSICKHPSTCQETLLCSSGDGVLRGQAVARLPLGTKHCFLKYFLVFIFMYIAVYSACVTV